jgi:hypothetical protein
LLRAIDLENNNNLHWVDKVLKAFLKEREVRGKEMTNWQMLALLVQHPDVDVAPVGTS